MVLLFCDLGGVDSILPLLHFVNTIVYTLLRNITNKKIVIILDDRYCKTDMFGQTGKIAAAHAARGQTLVQ